MVDARSRALACAAFAFGTLATPVAAQPTPPPGARLLFEVQADGVQIYACEQTADRWGWSFKGPEATLFDAAGRQLGTHGAGPHWLLADGSRITGRVEGSAPAPVPGAIPWLLLRATPTDAPGALPPVTWVRRFDTRGGRAPAEACDAARAGTVQRMRYSAAYGFYAE